MTAIDHVKDALGRALRQTIGPAIGAAIVGYFAYHAIQGDRGLIALSHLQNEIQQAEAVLAQVRGERTDLEQRASLLKRDHLDRSHHSSSSPRCRRGSRFESSEWK